jgi:hypothetical protein
MFVGMRRQERIVGWARSHAATGGANAAASYRLAVDATGREGLNPMQAKSLRERPDP